MLRDIALLLMRTTLTEKKEFKLNVLLPRGPTSFGPRSEYDEIYFVDFKSDGLIDGSYKNL